MQIQTIKKICNKNDFKCEINKRNGKYDCYIGTYTDFGQEWYVEFSVTDIEDLTDQMYEYLDTYDEDYEASLWIGDDGHGKNGAPYHIADIVADMMDGWNKLNKLYEELRKI